LFLHKFARQLEPSYFLFGILELLFQPLNYFECHCYRFTWFVAIWLW